MFHDTALQTFGLFNIGDDAKLTYALSLGKGAGISSIKGKKNEYYAYIAYENFFHKGDIMDTQSLKTFAWYQQGKRNFPTALQNENWFDRVRMGAGITYNKDNLRAGMEFVKAQGSILHGVVDMNTNPLVNTWNLQYAANNSQKADGGSFDIGYKVIPRLTLLTRYDYLNMLTNSNTFKKKFQNTTFGVSYEIKGVNRIDINYVKRDIKTSNAQFQPILNSIDDIFSVRFTFMFNSKMM